MPVDSYPPVWVDTADSWRPGIGRVGAAFRRLSADQWFVGSQVRESAAPFGQPLFLGINSLDATLTYGVTDRVSGDSGEAERLFRKEAERHSGMIPNTIGA